MSSKDTAALRFLAESLGVKYNLMDALIEDNRKLRGILTGMPSDVSTMDD